MKTVHQVTMYRMKAKNHPLQPSPSKHLESWQPVFHPPERSLEKSSLGKMTAQQKRPQDNDIKGSPTKESTPISELHSKQMSLTYYFEAVF